MQGLHKGNRKKSSFYFNGVAIKGGGGRGRAIKQLENPNEIHFSVLKYLAKCRAL